MERTVELFTNWKSLKKELSVSGKTIELISVDHVAFKDVYYIEVNGVTEHMQYGTSRLHNIFNEFITEEFDLIYGR
jgi:hypothetical protein